MCIYLGKNARHQAITWNNVDLSSVRFLAIHLRALSLDDVKIPINKMRLKIAILKWHLGLAGADELKLGGGYNSQFDRLASGDIGWSLGFDGG